MCLLSFHLKDHPTYKFIFTANRDEAYSRPTKEAHFWDDHPYLLGGRDLEAMGTWLGITKSGRFAALTNYREFPNQSTNKISRGNIVTSFLTSNMTPTEFLNDIDNHKDQYDGFNVVVGSVNELYYYSNRQQKMTPIKSGTHALSNAFLNTEWPKTVLLKNNLKQHVENNEQSDIEGLLTMMNDSTIAADELLPNTGVGLPLERILSPIFIQSENYGTKSTTVILVTHDNEVTFVERTYEKGQFLKDNQFKFTLLD